MIPTGLTSNRCHTVAPFSLPIVLPRYSPAFLYLTLNNVLIVFTVRVDEDLIKNLKHLAVDEDESLSNILDEAIEDLLKKYEKKPKK